MAISIAEIDISAGKGKEGKWGASLRKVYKVGGQNDKENMPQIEMFLIAFEKKRMKL